MGYPTPQPVTLSSVLTRPNDTTAYTSGDLIASNTTANLVVVPSFVLPAGLDHAEALVIQKARLITNKGTGMTTFSGHVDLWTIAPTFTNGDNGAYAVATGAASWAGHLTGDVVGTNGQFADGAAAAMSNGNTYRDDASEVVIPLTFGKPIFWSLRELDATGFTPAALQTFTLWLDGYLK